MRAELQSLVGDGIVLLTALVVLATASGVTVAAPAAGADGRSPVREITSGTVPPATGATSRGGAVASTTNAPGGVAVEEVSNRTGPDVDGFERRSPGGWTISGNCDTQGTSTGRAYRGNRSLVLSTAQPGGPCDARRHIDTRLNGSPVVFSTAVLDATVDPDGGLVEYSTAATRGGADAIRVAYEAGRETRFKTYDASGDLIEERTFEPIDPDTWYTVEITVFPGNSSANIEMRDRSGTFASAVLDASGTDRYTYAHLIAGGYAGGKQYFDDVSLAPNGNSSDRTGAGANVSRVAFDYADLGGNVNLEVNGDRRHVADFTALDGATVGGAAVGVTPPTDASPGTVVVDGTPGPRVTSFSVGGQELMIDGVRFGPATDPEATVEFGLLTPASSGYAVGETFTASPSGVRMTVEPFRAYDGSRLRGTGSRVESLPEPFSPLAGAGFLPGNVNLRFNVSSVTESRGGSGDAVTIVGYDPENGTTERRTVRRTDEAFPFAAASLPSDRSTFPEVTADDTKRRIDGTGAYPWSAVGTVSGNRNPSRPGPTCSGAVIEGNHVLTAAHCVYNHTTGYWLSSRSRTVDWPPIFRPGDDADQAAFTPVNITYIQTYEPYVATGNATYDIAVLTLADEVAPRTGTFGYEAYPPGSSRYEDPVHLTGYPSTDASYVDAVNEQWDLIARGAGTGVDVDECTGSPRCHALDTGGPRVELTVTGQSGGPVWHRALGGTPTVLSVVSRKPALDLTRPKTAAVRISNDTYSDVGRMVEYGNDIALAPTARATANDTSAIGGRPVELSAATSADPNGDALTYEWTQLSGPDVTLSDPGSTAPEFTTPSVEGVRDLEFELTVRDATGRTDTATVTVRVAPGAGEDPEDPPAASVNFPDQTSRGEQVRIDTVSLRDGGFVAIHDTSLLEGATFDSVLGHSAFLPPGEANDVFVTLDTRLTESRTLVAVPHRDDGDETFGFVESGGAEDAPYLTAGGSAPVTDPANITVAQATLAVRPPDVGVPVGGETTLDIVLANVSDGVSAYALDLSVGNTSTAEIAAVSAATGGTDLPIVAPDGSNATVAVAEAGESGSGPITLATVTVRGNSAGETALRLTTGGIRDADNDPYVFAAVRGATLRVGEAVGPPAVCSSGSRPTDPDSDGVYEDLTGDGTFDVFDAQCFLTAFDTAPVQSNAAAFDFTGDGSVDVFDVQVALDAV